jgi:hypothetical protein
MKNYIYNIFHDQPTAEGVAGHGVDGVHGPNAAREEGEQREAQETAGDDADAGEAPHPEQPGELESRPLGLVESRRQQHQPARGNDAEHADADEAAAQPGREIVPLLGVE